MTWNDDKTATFVCDLDIPEGTHTSRSMLFKLSSSRFVGVVEDKSTFCDYLRVMYTKSQVKLTIVHACDENGEPAIGVMSIYQLPYAHNASKVIGRLGYQVISFK